MKTKTRQGTPRALENVRRNMEARRRTLKHLAINHPEEFRELLAANRRMVDQERGRLPD